MANRVFPLSIGKEKALKLDGSGEEYDSGEVVSCSSEAVSCSQLRKPDATTWSPSRRVNGGYLHHYPGDGDAENLIGQLLTNISRQ